MTNESKKKAIKLLYDIYTLNTGVNERIMELFEEMQKEPEQKEDEGGEGEEKKEPQPKKPKASKKSSKGSKEASSTNGEQKTPSDEDGDDPLNEDEQKMLEAMMMAMSKGKGGKAKTAENFGIDEKTDFDKEMEKIDAMKEAFEKHFGEESPEGEPVEPVEMGVAEPKKGEDSGSEGSDSESVVVGIEPAESGEIGGPMVPTKKKPHVDTEEKVSSHDHDIRDKVYCGVCRKHHIRNADGSISHK